MMWQFAVSQWEVLVLPLYDNYLEYPHRERGFDNPHFDWNPIIQRNAVQLANGTKTIVTIIVPLEFFPLNPPAKPFKHPGAMQTPYPDLRHYTSRDYGNRVGVFRLIKVFQDKGIKVTFAVNAEVARRYAPLIEIIRAEGHEISAHGVSTAHIHHDGLSREEETELVSQTRKTFPEAVSWMSPARNQSYRTLELLAQFGFSVNLDWEQDILPSTMITKHGQITAMPNYNELSDFKILSRQNEEVWVEQIIEAVRYSVQMHDKEGCSGFSFTLTPYIAGQPFRIWAVRKIVDELKALSGVKIMTAQKSVETFKRCQE